MKKSRLLNILSSMLVGVIFMIAMIAVMIFSGAVSLQRTEITFSTESASAVYDGKPLTNHKWKLSAGELKKGHRAQVTVTGSQTAPGESENSLQVKILDAAGADVTSDYTINYSFGKLKVTPRALTVTSKGAEKTYDGSPLINPDYEVSSLIPGHKAVVLVTGSQTSAGYSSNTIQMVKILDRLGADVTNNYQITKVEEPLIVKQVGGTSFGDQDNEVDPEKLKDIVLYTVLANTSGKIYLKSQSFGNYTGNGFDPAVQYTPLIETRFAASYLSSYALWSQGGTTNKITVQPVTGAMYVLPYNMTVQEYNGYEIQTDDRGSIGSANEYTVDFYMGNNDILYRDVFPHAEYAAYEMDYRNFVYQNYTYVDDATLAFMNGIIAENGFGSRKADAETIKKVADYIMNAANYSFEYDRSLDDSENVAIAFLRDYKEGVCRHYAAAATMLFRTLGIPARYTEGVVANVETANVPVEVSALNVHAWVEVYIDGFGWQMVEVTGGNSAGGENAGEGGIDFGNLPEGDLSMEELENKPLFTVNATKTGPVYLKSVSYGKYIKTGFTVAEEYDKLLNNQYAASYLTSFAISGPSRYGVWILDRQEYAPYVLPYYMYTAKDTGYDIQKSDTKSIGNATAYHVQAYDTDANFVGHMLSQYRIYESEYASFVKDPNGQYMDIDNQTAEFMRAIIAKEGFNASDPDIISKVARYIQNAAEYNFYYNKEIDKGPNVAIAFLNAKEGVCRHYAMAATMLYRALGIPARYTEGVMVKAVAGKDVVATALDAHAWVEVYVDGIGWQMVEVTGGSIVPDKEISPDDIYMSYENGMTLDASAVTTLKDFEEKYPGYTYENLVVEGTQVGIGKSQSTIKSVTIRDPEGNDVTDEFIFMPGDVQIYRDVLKPVDVEMRYDYGMSTLFPETKLENFEKYEQEFNYYIDDSTFFVDGSRTEPGISASTVREGIVIRDMLGNDVTDEFRFAPGFIHVYREVIKPYDEEMPYDYGMSTLFPRQDVLENFEAYREQGYELVNLRVDGSQQEPGISASTVGADFAIYYNGEDVTSEFKIVSGKLHVYRDILYPIYMEKPYDGMPLVYTENMLANFEQYMYSNNYSITRLMVTTATEPGRHASVIEYVEIHDILGNDVTNEFKFIDGEMHIYRAKLKPFNIEQWYDPINPTWVIYTNHCGYDLDGFQQYYWQGYYIEKLDVSQYIYPGIYASIVNTDLTVIRNAYGENVTDEFKFEAGIIHIYRAELSPHYISKPYDGTPLVYMEHISMNEDQYPYLLEGFAPYAEQGYRIDEDTFYVEGSQTVPGWSESRIGEGCVIFFDGKDVTDEFKFVNGGIQIDKCKIDVQSQGITSVIGEKIDVMDRGEITTNYLPEEHTLTLKNRHAFRDDYLNVRKVGTHERLNTFDIGDGNIVITNANGEDVTEYFEINPVYGSITLTERNITVFTGNATKSRFDILADGQPLSYAYADIDSQRTEYQLISGDRVVVDKDSVTSISHGVSKNILTVKILDADGNDVTDNYNITYVYGTLTVTLFEFD